MTDKTTLPLTETTVVAASDGCASSALSGEIVVLHLGTGVYYGLNEVGARIWELLQSPRSVGAIRDELLNEFETDAKTCIEDLVLLLNDLRAAGLVELRDGQDPDAREE